MTYQQVRDVVLWLRRTHLQMRDLLRQSKSQTTDPWIDLTFAALLQDEHELQRLLARYGAQDDGPLLDTWLQYVPDEELALALAATEFGPNLPADEIVARLLRFDQAVITLLQRLSEETAVPRVQDFFSGLREHIESRAARQALLVQEYLPVAEHSPPLRPTGPLP